MSRRSSSKASGGGKPSEPAVPRLSASLILIKPLVSPAPDGYNYRTLLLQRHASGSFQSAHVFPGGNIDKADQEASWAVPGALTLVQSLKVCAIRETFEECGMLVATDQGASKLPEEERMSWRKRVHEDASLFQSFFEELSSQGPTAPDIKSLVYRGNFVTPRIMKKRWDTHFFLSVLPPVEENRAQADHDSIVTSDGVETVAAEWFTPLEAVNYGLATTSSDSAPSTETSRSIILAPPQFYFLAELLPFKDWRQLLEGGSGERAQKRKIIPFEPELNMVDTPGGGQSVAMALPGDPLHTITPSLSPAPGPDALHRTYIVRPSANRTAGDLRVTGVHRHGLTSTLGLGWEDIDAGNVFTPHEQSKL